MKPRAFVSLLAWMLLLTAAGGRAHAQIGTGESTPSSPAHTLDVTPFMSYDSSSFRIGAALRVEATPRLGVEAEIGYGDVFRGGPTYPVGTSVNLLYSLRRIGRVSPYFVAGAGLEQYQDRAELITGADTSILVLHTSVAPTLNAGTGFKIAIGERAALRTDARWINGFGSTAPRHWRVQWGVTFGLRSTTRRDSPSKD